MFSKALLATSLSETSAEVVRCLKGLRKAGTNAVLLVHALNIRDVGGLYDRLRELAVPKLEEQKRQLEQMGHAVEVQIPLGFPHYEINRLAEEKKASLIIVCSTAETVAADYFLGGVAHDVLNRAEKPVLMLRARMIEENGGTRCNVLCEDLFNHVLFPTDFSDGSERAFAYVEKIVESGCKQVTLLHVQEKSRISLHLEERLEGVQPDRPGAPGAARRAIGRQRGHPGGHRSCVRLRRPCATIFLTGYPFLAIFSIKE